MLCRKTSYSPQKWEYDFLTPVSFSSAISIFCPRSTLFSGNRKRDCRSRAWNNCWKNVAQFVNSVEKYSVANKINFVPFLTINKSKLCPYLNRLHRACWWTGSAYLPSKSWVPVELERHRPLEGCHLASTTLIFSLKRKKYSWNRSWLAYKCQFCDQRTKVWAVFRCDLTGWWNHFANCHRFNE